jgi:hypothetical protein
MERWEEGRITFDELTKLAEAFVAEHDRDASVLPDPDRLRSLASELALPGLGETDRDLDRDQLVVLQALLLGQQQENWADQADAVDEAERMLRDERSEEDGGSHL